MQGVVGALSGWQPTWVYLLSVITGVLERSMVNRDARHDANQDLVAKWPTGNVAETGRDSLR
jgi:hypothetical protein